MKKLWDIMNKYQTTNIEEEGISFTKEEFTKLYNHMIENSGEWERRVKDSTVKGILIGATSVGLISLGMMGLNKLRKRRLEDGKLTREQLEEMGITPFAPELMVINEYGKIVN